MTGVVLRAGRYVTGCSIGASAEKVVFHLACQVLAGTGVGQVQAVLVDQHGLVLEPVGPGLLAHVLKNALAQFSGVGRKVQTFGFLAQFDALNSTCQGDSLVDLRCLCNKELKSYWFKF